ncbi:hypothetical protein CISIN_1g038000mg, partial [Citrus sinensis]
VYGN